MKAVAFLIASYPWLKPQNLGSVLISTINAMGRIFSIKQLDQQVQLEVDRTIRSHGYVNLDRMLEALQAMGLSITRSSLYRYVVDLRARDALTAHPDEGTIITVVERSTGQVRVIKTSMSADSVVALLEGKRPR